MKLDTRTFVNAVTRAVSVARAPLWCLLAFSLAYGTALRAETISDEIQSIKARTLELNRDLFILEEDLLFPDDTQFAVFVSMDIGEFFDLDAVKLTIDGEIVSHYLYTQRQVEALHKGGVHRLFQANLKAGTHEVVAVFNGRGPHGRDYRRATKLEVEKARGAKHLELVITDDESSQQPVFDIRQW